LKEERRVSSERPDAPTAYSNTSFQVRRRAMLSVVLGEWKAFEVVERRRGGERKRGKKRGDIMMGFTKSGVVLLNGGRGAR
jgi:hypothetical protein